MADEGETAFPAAQTGSAIAGDLDDADAGPVSEFARYINDPTLIEAMSVVDEAWRRHDDDFAESRLHDEILRASANQTASRSLERGNVSRMQGMTGLVDHGSSSSQALDKLIQEMNYQTFTCYIAGAPESGKSNTALWLGELGRYTRHETTIVTNIPVEIDESVRIAADSDVELRDPDTGDEVSLEDVKESYSSGDLELYEDDRRVRLGRVRVVVAERETHVKMCAAACSGRPLVVPDEWGQARREQGEQTAADTMLNFVAGIRKEPFTAAIIVISQANADANKKLREMLQFAMNKPDKRRPEYAEVYKKWTTQGGEDELIPGGIDNIPETTLRYDDRRDPVWVFDGASTEDDDDADGGGMTKKQRVRQAQTLRDKYGQGTDSDLTMTLEEIGDAVDRSNSWVSDETEPPKPSQ